MRFAVMESTYAVFDPLGGVAGELVTGAACDAFRLAVEANDDVTSVTLSSPDGIILLR
jgi:hypothetical protein